MILTAVRAFSTERQNECRCWSESNFTDCECVGEGLVDLPEHIGVGIKRLTIQRSGIRRLKEDSLYPYRNSLTDLTLISNNHLSELSAGLLHNMHNLTTLYIVHAPALKSLEEALFDVYLPKLQVIRIMHSGLEALPLISNLRTHRHMAMLDLESNMIKKLVYRQIKLSVDSLLLSDNKIESVEGYAFQGSEIRKLVLRGNKGLRRLDPYAFFGIKSLRDLDLSETSISFLPTQGLQDLEYLMLQNVRTLKIFPSIYNFPHILSVNLTYAYHCCAFHFPSRHDAVQHAKHQEFLSRMMKKCPKHRHRRSWGPPLSTGHQHVDLPEGTFHQQAFSNVTEMAGTKVLAECGNLSKDYRQVTCDPTPDAFNPCEDIMGNWTLRVAVWLVAVAALLGNTAVLVVLLCSWSRMTVPRFLMCNLAAADLCMGVYLLMIAAMDARSIGDYFNYAIDWQSGYGCQIAGFLTVFSSELSILTLTVITSERWYTITYAIHMNKRLKLSTAAKIMTAGWAYALIMAALPLLGVSGYFKTSICLPLELSTPPDLAYLITLLTFNGLAFWVICLCYGKMYCTIRQGSDAGAALNNSDMTVAKRMALLVFTDFACWAPIAFFGLTALAGYPLIDVTNTKILLVFFYPLNSCANPYLYALLTHQYRRDVIILLSRCGLCIEHTTRYRTCSGFGGSRGSARQRPGGRGSLLTTLTSLDCARQHSLPETTLRLENNGASSL